MKVKRRIGIYSTELQNPALHSRMEYVLNFIKERSPQLEFILLSEPTSESCDLLLFYTEESGVTADIFIPYTGKILVDTPEMVFEGRHDGAVLFPQGKSFDIFAAIFHTILRSEEELVVDRDMHGRFWHEDSWHWKASCLDFPIVDIWIDSFLRKLKANGSAGIEYPFKLIPTVDVDYAWLYRNLQPIPFLKRLAKSIITADFKALKSLIIGGKQDPYDTFDRMLESIEDSGHRGIFFLLLGGNSNKDSQTKTVGNAQYKELVMKLTGRHDVGIHPSFHSYCDEKIIADEVETYTRLMGEKPRLSRQHFLRIEYPQTIRLLEEQGIENDYTMAYAGREGWRNGTSYAYPWYDKKTNKILQIRIHPLQFMDVTMTTYRRKSPEESSEIIFSIKEKVLRYGGEFVILWHNSFFFKKPDLWWKIFDESLKI